MAPTAGVGDVLGPDVVGVVTAVPDPDTEPRAEIGGEFADFTDEVIWRKGKRGLRPPPVLRLELLLPMSPHADCKCCRSRRESNAAISSDRESMELRGDELRDDGEHPPPSERDDDGVKRPPVTPSRRAARA